MPIASEQRVFPGDIVIVNGEQGRLVVAQMLTLSSAQVIPSRSISFHAMLVKAVANRDPKPIREPEKRGRPGLDSQGLAGLLGLSSAGTMNNSNDKLAKNAKSPWQDIAGQ